MLKIMYLCVLFSYHNTPSFLAFFALHFIAFSPCARILFPFILDFYKQLKQKSQTFQLGVKEYTLYPCVYCSSARRCLQAINHNYIEQDSYYAHVTTFVDFYIPRLCILISIRFLFTTLVFCIIPRFYSHIFAFF